MFDLSPVVLSPRTDVLRRAAAIAVVCMLALFVMPSPARAAGYAADASFNHGQYYADAFASNSTLPGHRYSGRKIARAANGDVIVAALVDEQTDLYSDQHTAVGLIRYNIAGVRVPWSNPDPATTRYGNDYLFLWDSQHVGSIDDLQVIDDKIVVLYTNQLVGDLPEAALGQITIVSDAGRYVTSDVLYFNGGSSSGVRGAGVALYHEGAATYAAVVGTHLISQRPYYRRYRIESNGSLTSLDAVWLATSACWDASRPCQAAGIARSQDTTAAPPRLYVAYAYRNNESADADIVVSRMDEHGNGDPAWDPDNVHWNLSDGGSRDDLPVAIAVHRTGAGTALSPYRDEIFVATQTARACSDGIGLVEFNHDGGAVAGKIIGGSTSTHGCYLGTWAKDVPAALLIDRDRLVIPARHTAYRRLQPSVTDGELASFDFNLVPLGVQTFAFPIGQPRQRDSEFFGAAITGEGGIAMTGDLVYPADAGASLAGKQQAGTLRVRHTP